MGLAPLESPHPLSFLVKTLVSFPSVPFGSQPGMDPLLVSFSFLHLKVGVSPSFTLSQVWPDSSILMMLNIHKMVGVSSSWGLGVMESKMSKEASIVIDRISKMMDGSYLEYSWLDRII